MLPVLGEQEVCFPMARCWLCRGFAGRGGVSGVLVLVLAGRLRLASLLSSWPACTSCCPPGHMPGFAMHIASADQLLMSIWRRQTSLPDMVLMLR